MNILGEMACWVMGYVLRIEKLMNNLLLTSSIAKKQVTSRVLLCVLHDSYCMLWESLSRRINKRGTYGINIITIDFVKASVYNREILDMKKMFQLSAFKFQWHRISVEFILLYVLAKQYMVRICFVLCNQNVLRTKNTWLQLVSVHHVAGYTDIVQCDSIFCSWAKEKKSQANFP